VELNANSHRLGLDSDACRLARSLGAPGYAPRMSSTPRRPKLSTGRWRGPADVPRPRPTRETARAVTILEALHRARPAARMELDHASPFQLLIATILSAQCTDARVNQVTPGLFHAYPEPAAFARAPLPALEAAIRSTGFFRARRAPSRHAPGP